MFTVLPAIDLLGDEAVRLERGDYRRVALRERDPVALAERFAAAGAALIHVVDLDGARSGSARPALLGRLAAAAHPVPIQASGGIRSLEDAAALLEVGAARVVVGTAAFAEPGALEAYAGALGNRLVVAIDARGGTVAVEGWTRETDLPVEDAARQCETAGVERLLCTSVDRDGTLAGPDLELLGRVQGSCRLPLLAAGGVRSLADLQSLEEQGLEGAIVGRALLDGSLSLDVLSAPVGQ